MSDGGVQYGHMKLMGGYPVLYQYRLNYQDRTAFKFVVPAYDVKGKLHLYKGYTPEEVIAAYKREGAAVTKRDNVHRMADANKAFAHFAW